MRITLLSSGSRGDVQPYIALGRGLQQAGHRVVFGTHDRFAEMITEGSLDFFPIAGDPHAMLAGDAGRDLLASSDNPLKLFRQMKRIIEPLAVGFLAGAVRACAGADLIVCANSVILAGDALGEKLARPVAFACIYPLAPTRFMPSLVAPPLPAFLFGHGLYNRVTHLAALQTYWQMWRDGVNRARREVLDLPPRGNWFSWERLRKNRLFLHGFSEAVVPRPADWRADHAVTGYWFWDRPAGAVVRERIDAFVADGPAPVCVCFGSMMDADPGRLTELVRNALRATGRRGVLIGGWGALQVRDSSREFLFVDEAPYGWLFPRMSAVVHHGGAGTTGSVLRAGLPSVVVPYMIDQPFWGRQVQSLGAGVSLLRKDLTRDRLTAALAEILGNAHYRQRAEVLATRIRAEDGVGAAVRLLEAFARGGKPGRLATPSARSRTSATSGASRWNP